LCTFVLCKVQGFTDDCL